MSGRRVIEITNDFLITVDDDGVRRKIKLASDKQHDYMNSLRAKIGKDPLKDKMPAYKASKSIDFMLKQIQKKEAEAAKPNQLPLI